MTGRRGLLLALALAAVGAVLLLAAAGRPWARYVVHPPPPLVSRAEALSGRELTAVPFALGLVGLAGVVALLATRRLGRRLVGLLLVVAGAAAAVTTVRSAGPAAAWAALADRLPPPGTTLTTTGWWGMSVAGAVLLALAGGSAVIFARRWPGMGDRYEAPAAARARPADPVVAAWDALDRGDDPTA